ncbi:nucleolar protein Jip5 [Penicillium sp. IBT 16267x]|nr:nucleolar protein Jip5 [Penicillium sp. IBT 16267x]
MSYLIERTLPVAATFDTVCTLPLSADLFTQSIHPQEPVVSVGLASGHVQTFRLPSEEGDSDDGASNSSACNDKGHIDTMWRTRRHKGSYRCLGFGVDGQALYSAGTDGLVKAANVETGQVENKIVIPLGKNGSVDAPTVIHALSPQTLLLATDSSALHLYDLRIPYSKVSARPKYKQWVTTGGTTLAVTDLQRGVLVRSENQEEGLISSAYMGGLPSTGTSHGQKVIDERVYVHRDAEGGESIETLSVTPDFLGKGKLVAAGLGNGLVKFVRIGSNKVVSQVMHDETEGVVGLGFDVEGRMVSGGGQVVKVWHEAVGSAGESAGDKHMLGSASDDSEAESEDSDRDERQGDKNRKKRKRVKGKDRSANQQVMAFHDMD